MKKFLTIFILVVLVVGALWFTYHFYWVFGEGVKAGQLNNFTKKGYVFKTYEGKLIQAGFQGGQPGAVQSNEFRFSVASESVANQLMSNSGKDFELHYKEYKGALPWRGTSEFVVDSVYSMRDARGMQTPYVH
jgi:hypothetical protein